MRHRLRQARLLLLAVAVGCGGSGSSGGGGGVDGPGVMWPDRGGGSSSTLPASVETGRVVFRSDSGETCCVAVDPTLLTPAGSALLILDDLAPGPATVTIAGFPTDFAPAVPGITDTCKTVRPNGIKPCDTTRAASPSFESAPLPVNIVAGAQINLGDVEVSSLPFVLPGFAPAQNQAVQPKPNQAGNPAIDFNFTVGDAVTGVAAESVALDVTINVPDTTQPSQFRSLTKRIPVTLDPCLDGGGMPCSGSGDLDVAGFKAAGMAEFFPPGPAEARITAQNLADPARDVDFRYMFDILPEPTATATATAAPQTATPTAGDGGDVPAIATAPDPDDDVRVIADGIDELTSDPSATPIAANRGAEHRNPTPTPTETPAP